MSTPATSRPGRLRLLALALAPLLALTVACGGEDGEPEAGPASATTTASPSGDPTADGKCAYPTDGQEPAKDVEPPPANPTTTQPTRATLRTTAGDITITLEADKAPCTVNSFLSLAEQDYFKDTSCHRLTTEGIYVLQCGDPTGTGSGGPGYSFADELIEEDTRLQPCQEEETSQGPITLCTYGPGTVAMANAGPDTNGSQFFLVYDSSRLPPDYTVFGRMDAAGLKVVREVAQAGVGTRGAQPGDGPPKTPVTITDVRVG